MIENRLHILNKTHSTGVNTSRPWRLAGYESHGLVKIHSLFLVCGVLGIKNV